MKSLSPASLAQRKFWLLTQIEPDTPVYNLTRVILLNGKLNANALRDSFVLLVRRHEALRTDFVEQDGEVLQDIHQDVAIDLPIRDLTHLPAGGRRDAALRLAAEEGRSAFDLAALRCSDCCCSGLVLKSIYWCWRFTTSSPMVGQ